MNIDTKKVFNKLKDKHGEKFARIIRGDEDHGEDLCAIPNIVHILEFAGKDKNEAKELRNVILEIYKSKGKSQYVTNKNPIELLDEAGYDAFVVENEEQKNSIKKYYRRGEELCTFNDPFRHEKYYTIHAIKRGADKILPADMPEREDEYGRSVISIQIVKTGGSISIKNRYNHTVNNPDATFYNNPDNIIPGLSNSLKKYFNVDFSVTHAPLPNNFRIVNDQIVRFNYEVNNVYFGNDYYFSGSTITTLDKGHEHMLDYFILDAKDGTIKDVNNIQRDDWAYYTLQNEFKNKKIEIKNNKQEKQIFADGVLIATTENGCLTSLNLPTVDRVLQCFLQYDKTLKSINLPNVEQIGQDFLARNEILSYMNSPNLTWIENGALYRNNGLEELYWPNIRKIHNYCLSYNEVLKKIDVSNAEEIGESFLFANNEIKEISFKNAKNILGRCLCNNRILENIDISNLEHAGMKFLDHNTELTVFDAPNLKDLGEYSLENNHKFEIINVPNAKNLGEIPADQPNLKKFYAPNLDEEVAKKYQQYFLQQDNLMNFGFQIAKTRIQKKLEESYKNTLEEFDEKYKQIIRGKTSGITLVN